MYMGEKSFKSDKKVERLSKEVKFRRLEGNENVISHCYIHGGTKKIVSCLLSFSWNIFNS